MSRQFKNDLGVPRGDFPRRERNIQGWYYLHTNGDLIYKPGSDAAVDIRDSSFAVAMWPIDPSDRAGAWRVLVEALAAGANRSRIDELADKWGCTDDDARNYADHLGMVLQPDGNALMAARSDFINLQESPAGFGETALEAFAELAKELGYRPSKMWGPEFPVLVAGPDAAQEGR